MRSDPNTFSEIVRTYQKTLYWYIRRLVVIHEDAEDILQDTFARAYRHLWTLREEGALKGWLLRIATNEVNRYFRRKKDALPLEAYREALFAETAEESAREVDAAARQLTAALTDLSPLQRQVFCLRYYEEMDYGQISRITGAPEASLRVSYHLAKEKIKKEILL